LGTPHGGRSWLHQKVWHQALVYYEPIEAPETAIRREKQIKDYARVKKLALIASINPEWNDLAELWFADASPADFSLRSK